MSYTPIGWQTGDTITAEKLNKMDNGWGVGTTQLFSETVTTSPNGNLNSGSFAYNQLIEADTITVTFDGTDYTCTRTDAFGQFFYGGFTQEGPDFSVYPFAINSYDGSNDIYTETAGTFTVEVSTPALVVSDNFRSAVGKCVDTSTIPLLCVSGVTTYNEMAQVVTDQNRLMFFFADGKFFIITDVAINDIDFIPENSYVSAAFVNDIFTVTIS